MLPVARYSALRHLGDGAAGGVDLVEDQLLGGAPLALKRLKASSDPRFAATFAEEFAVLASLALPGVARVVDLGVEIDADGGAPRPFFTREYVEDKPLDAYLAGADPVAITRTFVDVLRVVAPLHQAGVLHRDLKPANIIVDEAGQPHLIDFGLAREVSDSKQAPTAGTPGYMGPELFEGESSSVASDVYALGATLWRLLTGRAPFEERGARALEEKLRADRPPLPSGVHGRLRDVLDVCAWALARDPRDRAPNVEELAVRLLKALGDTPSRPSQPFVPPRPEGRTDLVARLLTRVRHNRRHRKSELCVVRGDQGMGKSTVLMELKWRLQLANVPVLHVRGDVGGERARQALAHHAALLSGRSSEEADLSLASLLAEGTQRGGWVVLLDDIDAADPELVAAVVEGLHAADTSGLQVVASCGAELPRQCTPDQLLQLEPLDRAAVDALAMRVWGSVDAAVREALWKRCAGNPGILVETLAALHGREGIAANDVAEAPIGRIGEHRVRAQLARLSPVAGRALMALAVAGGALPEALLRDWLEDEADAALDELTLAALLQSQETELRITDSFLRDWLRRRADRGQRTSIARELLHRCDECPVATVAQLAWAADDARRFGEVAEPAAERCREQGELRTAIWLYQRLVEQRGSQPALHLALMEAYRDAGEHSCAIEHAERVLEHGEADVDSRARALLGAAHALLLTGHPERAIARLGEVSDEAPEWCRIDAYRELARIHLRSGDQEAARRASESGLAIDVDSPARSELIAIRAFLLGLNGDAEGARTGFDEAAAEARRRDDRRAEARVLGYAGYSGERTGHLEQARAAYRQCLTAAQAAEDLGGTATYAMNLGNVSFRLGDLQAAQENYGLALKLARRVGQGSTEVLASNNLAHLHLYLGLYAQAESEAGTGLRVAENLGLSYAAAHARGILADVACRSGDVELGLVHYEQAAQQLQSMGRWRELAEARLDHASAILDAERLELNERVSQLLDEAAHHIDGADLEDFRPRLAWLRARHAVAEGRPEAVAEALDLLENEVRDAADRELLWCVLATAAEAQKRLGNFELAAKRLRSAADVIDAMANTLPAESREAFRADPRRRKVLDAARHERSSEISSSGLGSGVASQTTVFSDGKYARLLELIKRLAREHDVERLLERITDAAVELSGAERGFVLLVDEQGELQQHTLRERRTRADERHAAFSRSIAEAVLIDGEPIVTVDAQGDTRVNDFMSVHRLNLRSVACLPICGAENTVGVLYLEHRLRPGRFREQDLDLLYAFADQAAIAIENARLWSDLKARQAELQQANEELEAAKRDVERVLAARTQELHQVRRDLGRARHVLGAPAQRHGLVGRSESMHQVFELIERVQGSNVPVVIQGESGTGKELVARAIHAGSERSKRPFVAVNCGALPDALLESELFGHVRGAFTGADKDRKGLIAEAHGGTLFLDEFADIPMRMQVDLLRVLQERKVRPVGGGHEIPVDVRVVVASNRDVQTLMADKLLREDLFYRLSVVQIHLPPLRERPDDIPLLCDHLLKRLAEQHGTPERKLSRAALTALASAELPGNVRQLEHLLMSASLMTDAVVIDVDDLPLEGPVAPRNVRAKSTPPPPSQTDPGQPPPADLEAYRDHERERILAALQDNGWNRARAAESIGMPRRTFYRRLKQYGIQ